MMRIHARTVGALALVGLAACGDALAVNNYNSPDISRVLFSEASVEALVAGLGAQLNNPQRASESVNTQAKILSEESFASVANFGMAARVANRTLISNELGNDNQVGNLANFNSFQRVQRLAFTALKAYNDIKVRNGGTSSLTTTAENRLRAFAYFIAANAIANVAAAYDSLALLDETTGTSAIPGLTGAVQANAKAIEYFDSAFTIAGRGMDDLPAAWLSQTAVVNAATFQRLIRSYRARARANIARTPAERAAVNWASVIADATAGITADWVIQINGNTGWSAGFDAGQIYVTGGWHSLPMLYYGMADASGAYDAWLKVDMNSRKAFLIQTPDKRWPQGATRAVQQAEAPSVALTIPGRYFRNRPTGEDVPVTGWGDSWYDHRRWGVMNIASITGPYAEMSKTEIDMLAAEGYIRQGNLAAAAALIDITRTKNGLPSVGVPASATAPFSTAADCVPRVPVGPSFNTTACGSILEAMKYEKRMETAFTGYLVWFADSRGWGDLVTGTAVEWPVPYQEMQARYQAYHNGTNVAPKGTYGF